MLATHHVLGMDPFLVYEKAEGGFSSFLFHDFFENKKKSCKRATQDVLN